jgi:hypothetical protein
MRLFIGIYSIMEIEAIMICGGIKILIKYPLVGQLGSYLDSSSKLLAKLISSFDSFVNPNTIYCLMNIF